jgi:hypothetical protein
MAKKLINEIKHECVGCKDKLPIGDLIRINGKLVCSYCEMRHEQYKEIHG